MFVWSCLHWFVINFQSTVKPVYNDYPWNPKIVAVVDSWLLFRGRLYNKTGRYSEVVVSSGLTVAVAILSKSQGFIYYVENAFQNLARMRSKWLLVYEKKNHNFPKWSLKYIKHYNYNNNDSNEQIKPAGPINIRYSRVWLGHNLHISIYSARSVEARRWLS